MREFSQDHASRLWTETSGERRTIASGRSRASAGKRQRKRQKSPQVTDLRFCRRVATAGVSPAVSLFAGPRGSGPRHGRRRISRAFFPVSCVLMLLQVF